MKTALIASIIFGLIWASGLNYFDSNRFYVNSLDEIISGAVAGLLAGLFTIETKKHCPNASEIFSIIITYYIGIYSCFIIYVCFDDYSVGTTFAYLTVGSILFMPLLLPLTYCTREIVWLIYRTRKSM